jgi:hypothetical protein
MLMYIELKSGYSDNGPAWIARVEHSRSGRTVYFNGKALARTVGPCIDGNHVDIETGKEYWVSGVKKKGDDRHWAGSGRIMIEASAVAEYLRLTSAAELDNARFDVIDDLPSPDKARLHALENGTLAEWTRRFDSRRD